ncbi:glycosyltransferase family 4 protein [Sulfobacillus harzensis]|uniref:glycosyltransferase family 4 protein n=1 Tax=Sulfobacillus harzensis TaxID=2729629 RepID=UPI00308421C8
MAGGEERAVEDSVHVMRRLGMDPRLIMRRSPPGRVRAGWSALNFGEPSDGLETIFRTEAIEVVHVHNVMPMWMDGPIRMAMRYSVPAVVSIHNHRGFCINGSVVRRDQPCLRCLRGSTLPGVLHNCRDNALESMVYGLGVQRLKGMWRRFHRVIFPSQYLKRIYIEAGLVESSQAEVVPHLVPYEPLPPVPRIQQFLFVGRNSVEKGMFPLLRAWQGTRPKIGNDWRLTIVTDRRPQGNWDGVHFVPPTSRQEVVRLMRCSHAVVVPSLASETFSYVCLEALSTGTPVIASRIGALPEILGKGGLLVEPGDVDGLVAAMERLALDLKIWNEQREHSASHYKSQYMPEQTIAKWKSLYSTTMGKELVLNEESPVTFAVD